MAFRARIAKSPAATADRFVLCGRPGVGKTYFASQIPDAFLLFVEDGSKGMAPGAEPHLYLDESRKVVVPRTLAELLEAIDGTRSASPRHLILDSLTDVERLVHMAACGQERVLHMEGKEYKKVWAAAVPHWMAVQARLERVRAAGVHVWILAHSTEAYVEELSSGDSWRRLELAVSGSGTTAAESRLLWTRWADHVLFLDFAVSKTTRRKKVIAEYRGRVIHTRESASHFAKSRAEIPATIPATWQDLSRALRAGVQVSDRALQRRVAAALEELAGDDRASIERDIARATLAKDPRALSAALARAESLAAVAAREAAEEEPDEGEEPVSPPEEPPPASDPPPPPAAATEPAPPPVATEPAPERIDYLAELRAAGTVEAISEIMARVDAELWDEPWQEASEIGHARLIELVPADELGVLARQISDLALTEDRLARLRQAFVTRRQAIKGAA